MRKAIHLVSRLLSLGASACLIVIMLWISVDVVQRKLTGRTLTGVIEYVEILMAGLVFLGLAYAQQRGDHISVTALTDRLGARSRRIVTRIGLVSAAIVLTWLMISSTTVALRSLAQAEYRFGVARVPVWPARLIIPVCILVLLLEIGLTFHDARSASQDRSDQPASLRP